MLDRTPENGLLDVLAAEGIGCIPFCPLAQGQLTSRYLTGISEGSRAAKPGTFLKADAISPQKISLFNQLNEIAKQRGQTLAQMALAWVLRDSRITSALIGASRPEQIEENVKALANRKFSSAELGQIDSLLKGSL